MIRCMAFISKLPHISREAFIDYYERVHAPLINQLLPMYAAYRRHYLAEYLYPAGGVPAHDVVTELHFASEADYQAWLDRLADPAVIARIREDEANFLDSSRTVMWRIDCRQDNRDAPPPQ